MVEIAGSPADSRTLSGLFPQQGTQRPIGEAMLQSPETFAFQTPDRLQFEVRLRAATVEAARALDRSGMDFAVFRKSRCNPAFWTRADNGGFVLRRGVRSSEAIADIFENGPGYATECATAIVIVFYKAVLDVYSAPLFDRTFPTIVLMNWLHVDPLFRSVGRMRPVEVTLPGDRLYFVNPDVNPATPEWQGENVIQLGPGVYYGHGIGIHNAAAIIRELNENRGEDTDESAYLLRRAGRPDYGRLMEIQRDGETSDTRRETSAAAVSDTGAGRGAGL